MDVLAGGTTPAAGATRSVPCLVYSPALTADPAEEYDTGFQEGKLAFRNGAPCSNPSAGGDGDSRCAACDIEAMLGYPYHLARCRQPVNWRHRFAKWGLGAKRDGEGMTEADSQVTFGTSAIGRQVCLRVSRPQSGRPRRLRRVMGWTPPDGIYVPE